jgi:hypothetical protein
MHLSRNFQMKKEKEWMCKKLYNNRKKRLYWIQGTLHFPNMDADLDFF